jgi:exodeoxyribonuclease X
LEAVSVIAAYPQVSLRRLSRAPLKGRPKLKVPDPNTLTVEGSFLQRYNPGKPIALGALATHHIMDEDLADCPPYTDFRLPAGIEYYGRLQRGLRLAGYRRADIKRICVLALCRHFLPGLDSHSQSAVLYHLVRWQARELLKNAHSADADVYNCHIILSHLIPRLVDSAEPLTWERIWQRSELARIPTVMTFGKHKGMPIKDVPGDYRQWLLKQPDIDPYLIKALQGKAA